MSSNPKHTDHEKVAPSSPQTAFDLGQDLFSKQWFAQLGLLVAGCGVAGAIAFAAPAGAPDPKEADNALDQVAAALPTTETLQVPTEASIDDEAMRTPDTVLQESPEALDSTLTVGRGDTLMETLMDGGVERRDAYYAIEALSDIVNPRKIPVGQKISLTFENDESEREIQSIALQTGFDRRVMVSRTGEEEFSAQEVTLPAMDIAMYVEGTIDDSLYLSAERAGMPVNTIIELIRIFSFDVDFQREIWPGDGFAAYYERRISEETGQVENGEIIYGRLTLRGRDIELIRHESANGDLEYFHRDGTSVRRLLMKTPVDGARLSSRFGRRKHPVLGYTKVHKGADFAAPRGTPIMAAGNGVVERASRWGSFGNYIRIRHNGTYKTAYAHLNSYAKGVRRGKRVKQGQIIGYIGTTGRSTGPHLHYEVLKSGTQVNPLTLKLPTGRTLAGSEKSGFETQMTSLDQDMNQINSARQALAKIETGARPEDSGKATP